MSGLGALPRDAGGDVPHAVHAVGARASRERALARVKTEDGAWLALRGAPFAGGVAVVIDAARPAEIADVELRACGLTRREREVASMLAAGASNDAIAEALLIRPYTVKDHVKAIFRKTRALGRTAFALRFAGA